PNDAADDVLVTRRSKCHADAKIGQPGTLVAKRSYRDADTLAAGEIRLPLEECSGTRCDIVFPGQHLAQGVRCPKVTVGRSDSPHRRFSELCLPEIAGPPVLGVTDGSQ